MRHVPISQGEWDCWGIAVWQLKVSLLLGCWLSSDLYNGLQVLENALAGWYLLLLDCMESYGNNKESENFLASKTVKNLLMAAANCVERACRQGTQIPFHPCCTMEDSAEHHFGQVKSLSSVVTLKTALLGTQRLHLAQQRRDPDADARKACFLPHTTEEQVQEVAQQALLSALLLHEIITGQKGSDTKAKLFAWWDNVGLSIFARSSSAVVVEALVKFGLGNSCKMVFSLCAEALCRDVYL